MNRAQPQSKNPLAFLRRYASAPAAEERCELCSAKLADEHDHLIEPATRRLHCACTACAILFGHRGEGKFKRIPRDVRNLADLALDDLQWESFGLPVALAFFYHSSPAGRMVAVYPSPAGATESLVPLDVWDEFVAANPALRDLEPDVEALLVNRVKKSRDHFRVGIDRCYRLTGLVRTHWQGFSGGDAVWNEIDRFFAELRRRS